MIFDLLLYPGILLLSLVIHFSLIWLGLPLEAVPVLTFVLILVPILTLEKIYPFRKDWQQNRGDLGADLIQTLIILPTVAKAVELTEIYFNKALQIEAYTQSWPFWVQCLVVILFAEFLFYWYHRASHTFKFLLKFHAVHHGAPRVYWGNSGRFHYVDLFAQFAIYFIPVYLLGASPEVVALFLTLNAVTGTLEHANFKFRTILISRLLNTAELHRVHHSTVPSECNSNYGKILSVWDSIFGTYNKATISENFKVGLPGGRPVPYDLVGQLQYPFQKKKAKIET